VLHDQKVERQWVPLDHVNAKQASFKVCNSSLSEYAVLGFELGYSMVSPRYLTLWEAQFGDFANTAQPIIDQFIASGEKKWLQRTNLTVLLPHGYDGAGPEHSNAHIERFLSLCDEDPRTPVASEETNPKTRQIQDCNWQLVYPSTPANYFHALRRQIHRDFRKPAVIFTSKSLLRHPLARSTLTEMSEGTRFSKMIPAELAPGQKPDAIRRLIFCSGQVYYALKKHVDGNSLKDVAIARIEQLSPFPWDQVARELDRFPSATNLIWCQEEPMNLGPWGYMEPRFQSVLKYLSKAHSGKTVEYAGRKTTAAVATGYKYLHLAEEHELLSMALYGQRREPKAIESGVAIF
jgi:2-oxoglutarate dehydrogenase E1 component